MHNWTVLSTSPTKPVLRNSFWILLFIFFGISCQCWHWTAVSKRCIKKLTSVLYESYISYNISDIKIKTTAVGPHVMYRTGKRLQEWDDNTCLCLSCITWSSQQKYITEVILCWRISHSSTTKRTEGNFCCWISDGALWMSCCG
jgi:hypothetical protein